MPKKEPKRVNVIAVRAFEITKLAAARDLDPNRAAWAATVTANNPPGQVLHVDAALWAELNDTAQPPGDDANV